MGCVLKNNDVIVLMPATNSEQFYNTPLKVEFAAIFQELQLCYHLPLGVRKLKVESDSPIAIQAIINEGGGSIICST